MFSLQQCFLFCSRAMPTNNDGKDLACRLDKRLTHSQSALLRSFDLVLHTLWRVLITTLTDFSDVGMLHVVP